MIAIFLVLLLPTVDAFLRGATNASFSDSALGDALLHSASHNASFVLPIHEEDGTVHLNLWFGLQNFTLIIDTGSHLSALVCEECEHCGHHANRVYKETSTAIWKDCGNCAIDDSECNEEGFCEFSQAYSEGSSWTAREVNDIVIMGTGNNSHIPRLLPYAFAYTFGCQTKLTGQFKTQYADGILGVEPNQNSIIQSMADQGIIPRSSFSMCMQASGRGLMGFGGPLTRYHTQPMQFFDYDKDEKYYYFSIRKVWFGDVELGEATYKDMAEDKPMLDTGTTDIYLPEPATEVMTVAWKDITGKSFEEKAQRYTYEEFSKLPNLTFVTKNGVEWVITPFMYMEHAIEEGWEGSRRLVNRINTGDHGTMLGWSAMVGYDVYHDNEAGRIGISPCVLPDLHQIECCD